MKAILRLVPLFASFALTLPAQGFFPRVDAGIAFGFGELSHRTDDSGLDGDTSAEMFRAHFEAISENGFGGGLRLDVIDSDDDLFAGTAFDPSEAVTSSLFGHVTWCAEDQHWRLPLRIGLLLNSHVLQDQVTGEDVSYFSVGPQFEFAPEYLLMGDDQMTWSLHSTFALGVAATDVELDASTIDYTSETFFYGFEFGTRLRAGPVGFDLSYVLRGHDMAESDVEFGTVANGYTSYFEGVLLSFSAVF